MAEQCAVYICNTELLSNARIRHAAEGAKVRFFAEDDGHTEHADWVRFEIRWPDGVGRVRRRDWRDPELGAHLRELCAALNSQHAGEEMDPLVASAIERLYRSRNVLEMEAPPECAERLEAIARFIAEHSNALVYSKSALRDPHGHTCVNCEGRVDADAGWDTLPSALDRKARSEERMLRHGIPVPESVPTIEADEECHLRPPWEVARRASALVTAAARAEGLEQQRAVQFLQGWGLWEAASPKEQAFILNPAPPEPERIQFLWHYECLWVLLWALGHVETLEIPTAVCDVRRAVRIVTGTATDVFISKSNLRPAAEILDEADFIYRCHCVVNDAQSRGEPIPAGLDLGVVIERHIALNWLRCHHSQNWDEVTPDT